LAAIEQMDDLQKSALFQMCSASREAEAVEAKLSELRIAVVRAMHAETLAIAANDANNPPLTHQELHQQVLYAHDPVNVAKPKGRRPVNPKPAAELKSASENLRTLRDELMQAQLDEKRLTRIRGESIAAFLRTQTPITDETVRRQYMQRALDERADVANGTIAPAPAPPPPRWPIEEGYRARGAAPKKRTYLGPTAATKKLGPKF
jgi:hypothetical protein